jgi:TRAP transporter TAXI family solute receptor
MIRAATRLLLVALALGTLTLTVASSRDVRHGPADPPRIHVRIVPDTTFGDAFAAQLQRRLPDIDTELVSAIGSAATVEAIQRGEADLGFVLADVAYFGYLQSEQSPNLTMGNLRGIAALQIAPMYLLARRGVPVSTVHGLVGYRVGVGTALAGQSMLAGLLFQAYGLGPEIIQPDRRTDLLEGGVDATFATAYYPAVTVTRAMANGARLIPIDGPIASDIQREYPFVRAVVIPARTYPGQSEDVKTLGVQRLLVTSSRLDERVVQTLTRVFFDVLPAMVSSSHTSVRLTNLDQAPATPIPLHPGAAQYYRERELAR